MDKYIDEVVIRRELAINFALNNPKYDAYEGVPGWARRTLAEHSGDRRKFVYSLEAGAVARAFPGRQRRHLFALQILIYSIKLHPMTWRAVSDLALDNAV